MAVKIQENSQEEQQSWLKSPIKVAGVKFAPLVIPAERRLQTLLAAFWICCIPLLTVSASILLAVLLFTDLRWISILYISWWMWDCKSPYRGGWKKTTMKSNSFWKPFVNYFPVKLVKTADLDANKTYLIGNHPHGVLCAGAGAAFATDHAGFPELFPGLESRLITLPIQFNLPFHRDLLLSMGLCASTRGSLHHLLKTAKGLAVVLVPGGASEAAYTGQTNEIRLVLNKRKGFIKMALQHGVDLVPSFSFGETSIFQQYKGALIDAYQKLVKKYLGFIPVIVSGRGIFQYSFGIVPHRRQITVVVGSPIPVEKNPDPSDEDIMKLHAEYVSALRKLFDDNKAKYGEGDGNRVLVID